MEIYDKRIGEQEKKEGDQRLTVRSIDDNADLMRNSIEDYKRIETEEEPRRTQGIGVRIGGKEDIQELISMEEG